jgi:hypothetical protein
VSPTRRWLRRSGYLIAFFAWLGVMCLPLAVIVLAARGELNWKRGEFVEDRLWLIQDVDARGLGHSSSRVISNQEPVDGPICVRTRVRFLMWKGTAEPSAYCECYTAGRHEPAGICP